MWALYKKELLIYFKTPLGYIFLAFILFFTGAIFSVSFLFRGNQNFVDYLQVLTSLFAVIIPLLTMRIYSEEFKNRTDQLLLTQPIALHHIVLAKFLSVVTVFSVIVIIISMYLIVLYAFGTPDWAHIVHALIGFILLGMTLLSLGVSISSYTQHQLLAAILSFISIVFIIVLTSLTPIIPSSPIVSLITISISLMLILLQFIRKTKALKFAVILASIGAIILAVTANYNISIYSNLIPNLLQFLSPLHRYQSFHNGIIVLTDVFYFFAIIFLLQYLTYINIEKHYYKEK